MFESVPKFREMPQKPLRTQAKGTGEANLEVFFGKFLEKFTSHFPTFQWQNSLFFVL
jgi:hypothetical protein